MKITLPEGHDWNEVEAGGAVVAFQCDKCGASFIHDLQDDSQEESEGDGSCDGAE